MANQADFLQSSLDLNALLQAKQNQIIVIAQAKDDLLNTMAMPTDTKRVVTIEDSILVDTKINFDGVNNSIATGITQNPQLQALAQQVSINQLIEKETKGLMYPTLRASTGYNISSSSSAAGFSLLNENYGPFLGVNLSVPIYGGGAAKKNLKNARINTRTASLQSASATREVWTNAFKTNDAYQNSIQQLPTETENYNMSQALLELIMQKYQLGQATMVDVKQAQQSFESAGFRLVSLRYTAKVAEIELKRLSNQLSF